MAATAPSSVAISRSLGRTRARQGIGRGADRAPSAGARQDERARDGRAATTHWEVLENAIRVRTASQRRACSLAVWRQAARIRSGSISPISVIHLGDATYGAGFRPKRRNSTKLLKAALAALGRQALHLLSTWPRASPDGRFAGVPIGTARRPVAFTPQLGALNGSGLQAGQQSPTSQRLVRR